MYRSLRAPPMNLCDLDRIEADYVSVCVGVVDIEDKFFPGTSKTPLRRVKVMDNTVTSPVELTLWDASGDSVERGDLLYIANASRKSVFRGKRSLSSSRDPMVVDSSTTSLPDDFSSLPEWWEIAKASLVIAPKKIITALNEVANPDIVAESPVELLCIVEGMDDVGVTKTGKQSIKFTVIDPSLDMGENVSVSMFAKTTEAKLTLPTTPFPVIRLSRTMAKKNVYNESVSISCFGDFEVLDSMDEILNTAGTDFAGWVQGIRGTGQGSSSVTKTLRSVLEMNMSAGIHKFVEIGNVVVLETEDKVVGGTDMWLKKLVVADKSTSLELNVVLFGDAAEAFKCVPGAVVQLGRVKLKKSGMTGEIEASMANSCPNHVAEDLHDLKSIFLVKQRNSKRNAFDALFRGAENVSSGEGGEGGERCEDEGGEGGEGGEGEPQKKAKADGIVVVKDIKAIRNFSVGTRISITKANFSTILNNVHLVDANEEDVSIQIKGLSKQAISSLDKGDKISVRLARVVRDNLIEVSDDDCVSIIS